MKKIVVRKVNGINIAINTYDNDCFEVNDIVMEILESKVLYKNYLSRIAAKYQVTETEILNLENEILEAFYES